jgi:integrase/recombinase XerC
MISSFLKYLQFEKRLSPHTIKAYETDLGQFSQFLETTYNESETAEANHSLIRSWIISLVESGLDAPSVNRKIACLRSYFKFLLRQEVIKRDPMTKIRVLKTRKKLPSFVKESEMDNVLDDVNFENTFEGSRDRLILELFYGTGIRLSELLTLKESSVDFSGRTIKVLGKRNKERVIPFTRTLVSVIEHYREKKMQLPSISCDNLLTTEAGTPCYPMLIYRIVRKNLQLHSTSDKTSPHVLRHTYATHLLNKGAEINAVKDLLGHASLAATQVYTHNSMEKLKKAFDQAHPKA